VSKKCRYNEGKDKIAVPTKMDISFILWTKKAIGQIAGYVSVHYADGIY
jgi:hypothetical protein